MQTVGSVNFLGTLGHHTGLEQSCIQGLLQVSLVSGTGPSRLPSAPPQIPSHTHMAHSLGTLDLNDSPATQVTGEI